MKYQIKNDKLKVEVSSCGAELCSIQTADGTEYMWQGDPATWKDQAPTLFPYVGRMHNKTYQYLGQEYTMPIHGFAPKSEFTCQNIREDYLICVLEDSEDTRSIYPFAFRFEVHYELEENKIRIYYIVKNKEGKTMYFGIGGHPGFNVPLREGERFEDYFVQFLLDADPRKVRISDTGYVLEGTDPFELGDGNRLWLNHHLFDHDAIVLQEMGNEIQLCGPKGPVVTVRYPQMDYLGLWQWTNVDVPYLCIEPWCSLPSRLEVIEDLEKKRDLIRLKPYEVYTNLWEIEIME